MKLLLNVSFAVVCSTLFLDSLAGEWSGEISLEARYFPQEPLDSRQHGNNLSAYFLAEYYHDWDDGDQRFAISPFLRVDSGDSERTHFDFRELYWRKSFANAEFSVGLKKIFWGVAESQHLVDVINQNDGVENLDTEDKLGQPMIHLSVLRDWGTLDFFLMPYFRERTFPGVEGRIRTPIVVDTDSPLYESGAEERHVDFAVRWSHYIGDFDLGLSYFKGTNREPLIVTDFSGGLLSLRPFYEQMEQISVDLQATKGSWLWKLEGLHRDTPSNSFYALVGGFEYTVVGLFESAADLGLIAEYAYDERDEGLAFAQNDLAGGFRLALNDAQSTELLAVVSHDLDNQSKFISIEGSRRIGQSFRIYLEGRFFTSIDDTDPLIAIANDDYIELSLTKFF
ncbi:MAG: hypothetical protein AAF438_20085 [Pseudomonadota bacterium]